MGRSPQLCQPLWSLTVPRLWEGGSPGQPPPPRPRLTLRNGKSITSNIWEVMAQADSGLADHCHEKGLQFARGFHTPRANLGTILWAGQFRDEKIPRQVLNLQTALRSSATIPLLC